MYEPGPERCDSDANYTPGPMLEKFHYSATNTVQHNNTTSTETKAKFRSRNICKIPLHGNVMQGQDREKEVKVTRNIYSLNTIISKK
jgi:hypothetical protein